MVAAAPTSRGRHCGNHDVTAGPPGSGLHQPPGPSLRQSRTQVTLMRLLGRERPGGRTDRAPHTSAGTSSGAPAAPALPGPAPGAARRTPATSMWQRRCRQDAPANNPMVRSQSACPFQGSWNCRFPLRAGALAAFSWLFHDREGSYPRSGDKILRDHEVPAEEPCPEVTSVSAGSFSPRSGCLHS
jgi:hypothetical protein